MSGAAVGRPLWAPFVLLAGSIVVVDQLTKAWIVDALYPDRVIRILGDNLRLIYTENNGALFGLFRGQVLPFALLSLVVMGLIVVYHGRSGRNPYMTLTLGLLLGGAIGNATDRLTRGFVVDFVDGGIGGLRWYTFNVADACISAAILLLIASAIRPSLAGQGSAAPGSAGETAGAVADTDVDPNVDPDAQRAPAADAGRPVDA